jgi:hypothetical protein
MVINPDKTECLLVRTSQSLAVHRAKVSLSFGGVVIKPADSLKYLGITLDSNLSFNRHCANVAASVRSVVRSIRHVMKGLSQEAACGLAVALGAGKPDYRNSVISGTSKRN